MTEKQAKEDNDSIWCITLACYIELMSGRCWRSGFLEMYTQPKFQIDSSKYCTNSEGEVGTFGQYCTYSSSSLTKWNICSFFWVMKPFRYIDQPEWLIIFPSLLHVFSLFFSHSAIVKWMDNLINSVEFKWDLNLLEQKSSSIWSSSIVYWLENQI
jgi:hypothetical protein